jgi:hypothetical protein
MMSGIAPGMAGQSPENRGGLVSDGGRHCRGTLPDNRRLGPKRVAHRASSLLFLGLASLCLRVSVVGFILPVA